MSDFRNCTANWSGNSLELPLLPTGEAQEAAAVCQELCILPLPLYHAFLLHLSSPSVGFLQPPGSEQFQMPQSPSPCSPPQMPQQYSGKRAKVGARVQWKVIRHRQEQIAAEDGCPRSGKDRESCTLATVCSWNLPHPRHKTALVFSGSVEVDLSKGIKLVTLQTSWGSHPSDWPFQFLGFLCYFPGPSIILRLTFLWDTSTSVSVLTLPLDSFSFFSGMWEAV